ARQLVPAAGVGSRRGASGRRGFHAWRCVDGERRAALQRGGGRRRAVHDRPRQARDRGAVPGSAAGDARAGVLRPHRVGRRRTARAGAPAGAGRLMPTFLTVYTWEMRKLWAQKRTYLGLGAAVAVPIILVAALSLQSGSPNDVAFGKYVRESGLAIP